MILLEAPISEPRSQRPSLASTVAQAIGGVDGQLLLLNPRMAEVET